MNTNRIIDRDRPTPREAAVNAPDYREERRKAEQENNWPVVEHDEPDFNPDRPVENDDVYTETDLFTPDVTDQFRGKWTQIQAAFVDEPRVAVEKADELVGLAIKRLSDSFGNERTRLEGQWSKGDNVSTEDLRVALQRYRSFFQRLMSI